jgi:uncharacterized membrane protein YcaP (DUF421 family)
MNEQNLRASRVSKKDLAEGVRQRINEETLDHVKSIIQERSGDISVVKK